MCLKAERVDMVAFCGVDLDVSMYRRLQRLGLFWPEMTNDVKEE